MLLGRPLYARRVERVRPLTRGMRGLFCISSLFVIVAGIQLFVLSGATDMWFAWTIEPPLTAAFIGAFYFASAVITIGSARERAWNRATMALPGVLAFVWLMLLATLLHLDKFHLGDAALITAIAAWAWMAVYVLEPPILLWLYPRQLRTPGEDLPCELDVPRGFRRAAVATGAALATVGAILFPFPGAADELWPWPLTPLTARAVAATLVGVGIVIVTIGRGECWVRTRWGVLAILTLAVLVCVALARYPNAFDWSGAQGVAFLAGLAALLAGSLYGTVAARRAGALG